MIKKNRTLEILSFFIAGLCIVVSVILAYIPRDPKSLPPSHISSFAVLEDKGGLWDIDAVRGKSADFIPGKTSVFFHTRSYSAFWIRFYIDAPLDPNEVRYLEIDNSNMEKIDIYFPGHQVIKTGRMVDIRTIPIKTRNQNTAIPFGLASDSPVYLRVETSTNMLVPIHVLTATNMVNKILGETLLFGCFFGIVIAIFFVNLFSRFLLRNHNFTIYLLYLASLLVYHFRVHGFLYLVPLSFFLEKAILWISLGGVGLFMMLFAKSFLDLKKRLPWVNRLLDVFIALFIIQTILGVFISSYWANQIAYVTGFLVPLTIIISTVKIYVSGYREARYYLLAWCALFTGTLIWSTAAYAENQISANYFFVIGTSIDSLLFTLAIFDQIRTELKEKDTLVEMEKHYKDLSRTDSLTGLYNRRYMDDMVRRMEFEDEISAQHAIIMMDLDYFKLINDTYGHPSGDLVLINAGMQIKKHIRKTDIASRYGGDEFLIFLPGANTIVAHNIAEEIRKSIFTNYCTSDAGDQINQTVSIGITENRLEDSFEASLLRADAALYKAKHAGRNCICIL